MMDSTNIINTVSEFKENQNNSGKSLRQRIEEAKSEDEVNYLMKIGLTYKKASVDTMKSWVKASQKRINDLKKQ